MQPPDRFETERLIVRTPRVLDADALFASYASDPRVTQFLTWQPHGSARETAAFLERAITDADAGRAFSWVLTERATERPIGMIVLSRDNPFCFHIGYVIEHASWNKGFITEAARPIVEWVKEQPEIFRVYAVCDVENPASARVMEKLKLRYEGLLRRALVHVNASPEPRDVLCFAWTR